MMAKHVLRFAVVAFSTIAVTSPAAAKKLYSAWLIEPTGPIGEVDAKIGDNFLEQRLVPYRLAQLSADAALSGSKTLAKGTYLFAVYQDDGKRAFCTIKDQSAGNVAKSLFIPALDRRPCLVDGDGDGRFEATFSVFDKYGSALTPSGNLTSAKALAIPIAYQMVNSTDFPVKRGFRYSFGRVGAERRIVIDVVYNNGSGYQPMNNYDPLKSPTMPRALNLSADITNVAGDQVRAKLNIDKDLVVIGDSGGAFGAGTLPEFISKAN
jgi:hypothetical protein